MKLKILIILLLLLPSSLNQRKLAGHALQRFEEQNLMPLKTTEKHVRYLIQQAHKNTKTLQSTTA